MAVAHRTLPARGALGCVLAVSGGIYEVWTSRGRERASMSGGLLAGVARDRGVAPVAGDWVEITRWHDGRVTLSGRAGGVLVRTTTRPHLRLVR
jgi:hypothetical protein